MRRTETKTVQSIGILVLVLLCTAPLRAQGDGASLVGTITNQAGAVVPNAKISVKNLVTGQMTSAQSDSAGLYGVPNLTPGEYELSISAEGFSTNLTQVKITAGVSQTLNWTLRGVLSLGDLGYSRAQTQGSTQDQARLNKRSHMLKIHQRLGLIDTVPLVATVIAGAGAGGRSTSTTDRILHLALGSVTGDLYFISAYYAIRAPKIAGTPSRGPIRLHKALAWVHGPGMIMTPILGAMAYNQKSRGERVHGIARAHGPVAIVTAGAYGAAILSVSLKW